MEKYINPFTDFGFKKIFGEEANKDLLLDFLNELLLGIQTIKDITFLKNEHLSSGQEDRKAIFDLYCENEKGEKFIIELQKAKQKYFKDRALYYATFPIQEQAITGDWNFKLCAVYTIAIMDFIFDENKQNTLKVRHDVQLVELETQAVFYDKLRFIFLEMPKFQKKEEDLETKFDKWLYVLKNLSALDKIPTRLQEKIFSKLFQTAEIAQYSPQDQQKYRDSLKYYRDIKNSLDTSFEEGFGEGFGEGFSKGDKQGKLAVAKELKKNGVPLDIITKSTGLSEQEIEQL